MSPKSSKPETIKRKKISIYLASIIVPLLILHILFPLKIWVITLIVLSGLTGASYAYRQFRAWQYRNRLIYATHCERLENLIHDIIDLAYVYDEDHTKFYSKFLETVSVNSLSRRGIINPDAMLRTSKFNQELKTMKQGDAELLALLMAGFSSREIKIIYGLKNMNSVYIKCHRLRSRMSKKMKKDFQ
jgi:hypothetical protein